MLLGEGVDPDLLNRGTTPAILIPIQEEETPTFVIEDHIEITKGDLLLLLSVEEEAHRKQEGILLDLKEVLLYIQGIIQRFVGITVRQEEVDQGLGGLIRMLEVHLKQESEVLLQTKGEVHPSSENEVLLKRDEEVPHQTLIGNILGQF